MSDVFVFSGDGDDVLFLWAFLEKKKKKKQWHYIYLLQTFRSFEAFLPDNSHPPLLMPFEQQHSLISKGKRWLNHRRLTDMLKPEFYINYLNTLADMWA